LIQYVDGQHILNSGPIIKWWTQYEIVDADEMEQYGQYIKNEVDIEDAAYNSKRSTVQYIFHEVHYGTQLTGHGKVHMYIFRWTQQGTKITGNSIANSSLDTARNTNH
jgi:hypothetical protein